MATLELYRTLIPAHGGVKNEMVTQFLTDAALSLTSAAWGVQYARACVYLAAHWAERTPGSGANGSTAEEAGAVTSQSDTQSEGGGAGSSSLSRSYASPTGGTLEEQDLRTTKYGQLFLQIRASRVARAPSGHPRSSSLSCWPYRRCL